MELQDRTPPRTPALALLDPAPWDATVTATSRAELLVVHVRHVPPLLEDVPLLARKASAALAHRLHTADEQLVTR